LRSLALAPPLGFDHGGSLDGGRFELEEFWRRRASSRSTFASSCEIRSINCSTRFNSA